MATPSVASTKETTNYARLCRLLVDVGSQALRDTFDGFYVPGNLHVFLSGRSVQSKLKSLRGKKILNPTQWSKLYPTILSTVTSAIFDITLLSVLLRNICGLSPPASTGSWDKLPPPTDTCREADLVRIKYFRNTVYGHAEKASVDDVTFNGLWHDIESAMVRLGGPAYAGAIAKLKGECMDPDIEEHYKEALLMWKKDEDNVKNKIEELDKKFQDFMKSSVEERGKLRDEVIKKLDYLTKREINRDKPRSELPEEVCNVRGHEKRVDDILQALSGEKRATTAGVLVSGTAGVGKSTVAIQAGHRLRNEFEAVVKFCSLRGAYKGGSDDDDVLREILNVCVPDHQQSSEYPKHVLLNWCRRLEYELVLIVDNAEDAIDDPDNYTFLNLLSDMRKCSDCKIKFLITSRRSEIETPGTVSNTQLVKIPVGPLDVRESIQVLKDSANLSFETEPNIEVKLRRIAELCENIPLALRLAGSLLAEESEYSFDGLIQELEKNPTKTLELEQMMEIAFKKLDEALKHALVCLSVFPRSFTRDAAEALLGKVNCAQHLTKLKKRCWIQKSRNRYLIHLLIRGYARQIGERKEFRQILALGQQRFIEHFLSQILRNTNKYWGKDTCKESLKLFNEERINLESTIREVAGGQKKVQNCKELEDVLDACGQVAPYIEACVSPKLYNDFLRGLLQFSQSQENVTKQVEILCLLYEESRRHGKNLKKASKELISRAIELHDSPRFNRHNLSEVFYLIHYGRYLSQDCEGRDEAQPLLQEAISILEKTETATQVSIFDKGRILGQMGHNARLGKLENEKRHEEALNCYQEALDFRQRHYGTHVVTALAHKDLANYYLTTLELGKAEENYEAAVRIFEDMEMTKHKKIIPTYKNFGRCYEKRGRNDQAREILEIGSNVADNTIEGNNKWKVGINTYLALLLYKCYPKERSKADKLSINVFHMARELDMERWQDSEDLKKFLEKK